MTILFFSRLFYPHIGGVEKHVYEISKRLVQQGHKVIIVTEEVKEKNTKDFDLSDFEIYHIPVRTQGFLKKFTIWQWLWKHRSLIVNADIVHCHDVFFWYLPFRVLYATKPVYTTFHGYESYPIKKRAVIIRKISEKLSWGNICIGDFMKKWYGTKPTFVSYGAVDDIFFEKKQTKAKKESAVFIGRLDNQTGITMYLDAVSLLRKKYPHFDFLVVGDGEQRIYIDKNIKSVGFQKNPEKYLQQYHFTFVSRYLSILEAFAMKRPVIAVYDNPVKEDYLKMSPFAKYMIVTNTAEDVAKQVEKLLAHPEKEKVIITNAYKWVSNQTWDSMVKLYITLWKRDS